MNLETLYEKIHAQILQGQQVTLNQVSTGVSKFDLLCKIFELEVISLTNADCTLKEELLTLTGRFDIRDPKAAEARYKDLAMTMTVDSQGAIVCLVELPEADLTEDGILYLKDGKLEIKLTEGQDSFSETLKGNMDLDKNHFTLCSERDDSAKRRKFEISYVDSLDIFSFLEVMLKVLNLHSADFHFDRSSLPCVDEFGFSCEEPAGFLKALVPDTETSEDCFELCMQTDLGFCIGGSFDVGNASFTIQKHGSQYVFFIQGDMVLFDVTLPFRISYADSCFGVSATSVENVYLQSVDDMGSLVGEKGILHNFPQTLQPDKSIGLYSLNMKFPSDLKEMLDFQIVVNPDYCWQLCSAPDINVSNLLLSFEYMPSEKRFGIGGNITFCGIDTQLTAAITSKDSKASKWSFDWHIYDDETISLNHLVEMLAGAFGVQTQIEMPEVETGHIAVTYCDDQFSIKATVAASNFKLFSSEMDMQFTYTEKKDSTDFQASFTWKSEKNSLNIEDILKECGAEEGLEAIPEFIRKIALTEVKLDYDFAENRLTVELDVEEVGKLAFELFFEKKKCQYALAVQFALEAGFGDLPAVGDLSPALQETKLKQFELTAASCDMDKVFFFGEKEPVSVKQGLTLSAELNMPEKSIPLELHLLDEERQDTVPAVMTEAEQSSQLIVSEDNSAKAEKVIDINWSIGPLQIDSIQLGYQDSRMYFGVTAKMQSDALTFSLEGLSIRCGLSDRKISFGLKGISVGLSTDAVTVDGGFLNSGDGSYAGTLMLKAASLSLTAVGAYREKPIRSFFVFASVKGNIGGPPCFSVTGLAAGFGYQRNLPVPEIEQLEKFPLLQAADGTLSKEALLTNTDTYFPQAQGQLWIAAGVLFNTFKMADSIAILSVSFGEETEITLTGRSLLNVPFDEKKAPVAHGVLLLKAAFRPADSLISVEAALGEDSYVLCKDCHITGGFAFYTWYGGQHSGDFVLTLGGYNPSYQKPAHYPDVERLGLSWKISNQLSAEGDIYFALTPSALMAGGGMKFLYSSSCVDAWLEARINALIQWKPYHYDFNAGVSAGVRVHMGFIRFQLELGCDIHIWGPEFSGEAHIKLWCITITVKFGAGGNDSSKTISAQEFKDSFLTDAANDQEQTAGKFRLSVTNGLLKEYENKTGEKEWVVSPEQLQLRLQTGVPVKDAEFTTDPSSNERLQICSSGDDIYVRPCGTYMKSSKLTVQIERLDADGNATSEEDQFLVEELYENMPSALWGEADDKQELAKHCTGVCIAVKTQEPNKLQFSLQMINMTQDKAMEKVPSLPQRQYDQDQVYTYLSHAADGDIAKRRQDLFSGLGEAYEKIDVEDWAARAKELFCAAPRAVSLGGVSK